MVPYFLEMRCAARRPIRYCKEIQIILYLLAVAVNATVMDSITMENELFSIPRSGKTTKHGDEFRHSRLSLENWKSGEQSNV